MQFTQEFKEAIRSGKISCSFRTWKSPQAKVGGHYNLHPAGAIAVTGLKQMRFANAKTRQVKQSGFPTREALAEFLNLGAEDPVYLVEFRYLGAVTVKAQPTRQLKASECRDLAAVLGWETVPFKANVRKLKKLGLKESLETGYRLTKRGVDVLEAL